MTFLFHTSGILVPSRILCNARWIGYLWNGFRMDREPISSPQETEYSVSCLERENPPILYLQYLVNYNVLQTFVEGLPALRQILEVSGRPTSHWSLVSPNTRLFPRLLPCLNCSSVLDVSNFLDRSFDRIRRVNDASNTVWIIHTSEEDIQLIGPRLDFSRILARPFRFKLSKHLQCDFLFGDR